MQGTGSFTKCLEETNPKLTELNYAHILWLCCLFQVVWAIVLFFLGIMLVLALAAFIALRYSHYTRGLSVPAKILVSFVTITSTVTTQFGVLW